MPLFIKISLLIFFAFIVVHPQNSEVLKEKIIQLLDDDGFFSQTSAALEIYDLTAAENIISLNNSLLLHPASNMKLLSSSAGLLFLGDYIFQTSLYYTGRISNGVLEGDLYFLGGCDPSFTAEDFDPFIAEIKKLDIREIKGNLLADLSFKDDLIWGKGWMWDDDPSADAPYLSALNLNYNTVTIYAVPSEDRTGIKVFSDPVSSYLNIDNKTVLRNDTFKDSLCVTREWLERTNNINISGFLNSRDTSVRSEVINIFDPANYFLTVFKEKLAEHNILLTGESGEGKVPVGAAEVYSFNTPLDSLLGLINKQSDNLAAEMVIYALAEKHFGRPASALNGILMIDSLVRIIGLNPLDYRFADGSGVSHYNLLSAELIVTLLKYLYYEKPDIYVKLYHSLASAGVDGTLINRMKDTPAEGVVHAKTGTLTGISCISGYVNTKSGRRFALSMLIQNFPGTAAYARYIQDQLCIILSEY